MSFEKAYIPYGGYWSTPFSRWQGSFAHLHAIKFAAEITTRSLDERKIPVETFDTMVFGMTIPQKHCFYGTPWLAGMIGATGITGPMIGQACATGTKCVETAAREIEMGDSRAALVVTTDRCSNGLHIYYPNPLGPGGQGEKEDWVMDNFGFDPFAKNAMIQTAENVARESGIERPAQDEITLMRYEQYCESLKDDAAFQKRYMVTPIEVKDLSGRKVMATVTGDEGIFNTTAEGLAGLRPVLKEGTVTFGSQTHPADGNTGIIVTTRERAKELSRDPGIEIQVVSYAQARAKKGFMAAAIVPAARLARERAGIGIQDMAAIKTHNPFAVNDVYFCNEMGVKPGDMNNYGSSLIYGHPQAPTASRLIIELIEELALKGGGWGLFDGCAAGDTGAALVLKVTAG